MFLKCMSQASQSDSLELRCSKLRNRLLRGCISTQAIAATRSNEGRTHLTTRPHRRMLVVTQDFTSPLRPQPNETVAVKT